MVVFVNPTRVIVTLSRGTLIEVTHMNEWQEAPMLAHNFDASRIKDWSMIYRQPKLDGIRAVWDGKRLWTRERNEIVSVPHIVHDLKSYWNDFPLDGEIIAEGDFDETSSRVRRTKNIILDKRTKYFVFDSPRVGTFKERWEILARLYRPSDYVKLVSTELIDASVENLDRYSHEGYEGTMIRNGNGTYAFGERSYDLLKIKQFKDGEFTCIGLEPLQTFEKIILPHREKGAKQYADGTWYKNGRSTELPTLGKMVLTTSDGQIFRVGSGFSEEERKKIWNSKDEVVGQLITVKYQELTRNGIPRFPTFVRIRDLS